MTHKKKKRKLKKQVYYFLAGIIIIIVGIILGINFYNDFKYKQTNEYKLVSKGYNLEDTKILLEKLPEETIAKLLEQDKNDQITALVKEKYFLAKNLDRYLAYIEEEEEENMTDVVAIVNVNADHKWYEEEYATDITLKEQMIVNKFYALNEEYTPENLVSIPLNYAYGTEGENQLIDYAYDKSKEILSSYFEKLKEVPSHFVGINGLISLAFIGLCRQYAVNNVDYFSIDEVPYAKDFGFDIPCVYSSPFEWGQKISELLFNLIENDNSPKFNERLFVFGKVIS